MDRKGRKLVHSERNVGEKMNLVFINSHPIQYFVPLYQQIGISNNDRIQLLVLYLSDETIAGYTDRQFGTSIKWDLPLLSEYNYQFVKNNSWKPSFYNGFWGLLNLGIINELQQLPKSVVVVSGWAYASNVITLWAAKIFGHIVCLRGENPLSHESAKTGIKKRFRDFYLKRIIFSVVDRFLYIGEQNRLLYKSFGVSDDRLIFTPYAVDNARFQKQYSSLKSKRDEIKKMLGLAGKKIILFSGKLIPKKRPLDLLKAYEQLIRAQPGLDLALVYVGDGELKSRIELFCAEHELQDVYVTGFVNQIQISQYYAIADLFVMCSGIGETWGLSTNEAMNFDLPVIVSDKVGCVDDLVLDQQNGFSFHCGSIDSLRAALSRFFSLSIAEQLEMGQRSGERIRQYSYEVIIGNLEAAFSLQKL